MGGSRHSEDDLFGDTESDSDPPKKNLATMFDEDLDLAQITDDDPMDEDLFAKDDADRIEHDKLFGEVHTSDEEEKEQRRRDTVFETSIPLINNPKPDNSNV
jgi:hypothetical protein